MQEYKDPVISAQLRITLKGHSSSRTSYMVGQLLADSSMEVPSDIASIHRGQPQRQGSIPDL